MKKNYDVDKLNEILGSGGVTKEQWDSAQYSVNEWIKFGSTEPLKRIAKEINLTPDEILFWFCHGC